MWTLGIFDRPFSPKKSRIPYCSERRVKRWFNTCLFSHSQVVMSAQQAKRPVDQSRTFWAWYWGWAVGCWTTTVCWVAIFVLKIKSTTCCFVLPLQSLLTKTIIAVVVVVVVVVLMWLRQWTSLVPAGICPRWSYHLYQYKDWKDLRSFEIKWSSNHHALN